MDAFGGGDEDYIELKKLLAEVVSVKSSKSILN